MTVKELKEVVNSISTKLDNEHIVFCMNAPDDDNLELNWIECCGGILVTFSVPNNQSNTDNCTNQ